MSLRKYAEKRLEIIGIPSNIIERYDEPHRFYHNWDHIETLLKRAIEENLLSDMLFLAIIFHDIIYDPKSFTNELDSAEFFKEFIDDDIIYQAILDTKGHKPQNDISQYLCRFDLEILYGSLSDFMAFEDKIFKEYQFVDYMTYKFARVEILKGLGVRQECLDYVMNRKPKIGIYAGSFNPFHKGHMNILLKAERIFDKVIIARGKNPDKTAPLIELPKSLQYRECVTYDELLTNYLDLYCYDVTLIRGLRNSTDLQYELTQYRFLQDLKPNINVVSIFCDKEYEHISSSAIRQLQAFGEGEEYLIK